MEYEVITIGEKDFPIKFGFNALRKYSLMTNTNLADLQNIGNDMDLNSAITLCYCGIKDGCRVAKKKFDLTLDDLADLFDGNWDCMENVFTVLAKQMSDGFEEKKKKPKKKKK
jgi:hypothetical protein